MKAQGSSAWVCSGSSGVGEAGQSPGGTEQVGAAVEEEAALVRRRPPGAGVLQGRGQHGQDLQLAGGTHAVPMSPRTGGTRRSASDLWLTSTGPAAEQHSGRHR